MSAHGHWKSLFIREFIEHSIPGEWGSEGTQENGVPVLRSTNFVDDGTIDYSDIAYRRVPVASLESRRINKGTILIEKAGGSPSRPAGRVVFCDRNFNGTASNFVEIVTIRENHSPKYVFYLLFRNFHTGVISKYQQQTTGIINFKIREYYEEVIKAPCCKIEQTKIAEILSTVDQAIDQTEALIAKQQRIKTGLMQDLLTRGIDENGNLRSEETHEFKDSPLGRIPVEWDSSPLFERRLIGRPHLKTGPFGSSLKLEHWRPTGVPVITIGALGAGSLINSELLYVSESTAMRLQNYRLEVGDIVFSRVADVGRSAVISIDQRGWIMSSNLMCISLDLKQVNAYFLQAQLSYESRIRQQILSSVNAGGRDVANTEILNSLQFLWPPLTEQTRIMDCLKALDGRIDCAVKELGKLSQVKTALMQDLLTGKVSVAPLLTDTEGSTESD